MGVPTGRIGLLSLALLISSLSSFADVDRHVLQRRMATWLKPPAAITLLDEFRAGASGPISLGLRLELPLDVFGSNGLLPVQFILNAIDRKFSLSATSQLGPETSQEVIQASVLALPALLDTLGQSLSEWTQKTRADLPLRGETGLGRWFRRVVTNVIDASELEEGEVLLDVMEAAANYLKERAVAISTPTEMGRPPFQSFTINSKGMAYSLSPSGLLLEARHEATLEREKMALLRAGIVRSLGKVQAGNEKMAAVPQHLAALIDDYRKGCAALLGRYA